jgi:hypothetical protein
MHPQLIPACTLDAAPPATVPRRIPVWSRGPKLFCDGKYVCIAAMCSQRLRDHSRRDPRAWGQCSVSATSPSLLSTTPAFPSACCSGAATTPSPRHAGWRRQRIVSQWCQAAHEEHGVNSAMWVASERQPGLGVVLDILDEDGQLVEDLSRVAARVGHLMCGALTLLSMFVDIHQWVANNLTSGARRRGRGTPLRGVLHGCRRTAS